jgi:hypothetical protein
VETKVQQRGIRPLRLFCETITSRFEPHPRFSGDTRREFCIRFFINGDSKVDLEVEEIQFSNEEAISDSKISIHQTLEDALDSIAVEPNITNQVYNYVLGDLKRVQG